MTALFCTVSVGYSTSFQANFINAHQFSGTAKPVHFCETHVVGVPKSPQALKSELWKSNDGSVLGRFHRLWHSLRADFIHPGQFSGTAKPGGFHKTHVVGVPKGLEALQSDLRNLNNGFLSGQFYAPVSIFRHS